jgi:subtilisin family serine protease
VNASSSGSRFGARFVIIAAVVFSLLAVAGIVWHQTTGGFGGSQGAQAGGEDPATYVPDVIAPAETDGFGSGDDVKEDYVLITVPDGDADAIRDEVPGAKLVMPGNGGDAVIGVPSSEAPALEERFGDDAIVDNTPISSFDTFTEQTPPSWGLDRIDQSSLPLDGTYRFRSSGSGITVYVVDTGINTDHRSFSGRIQTGFSAVNDGRGVEDCNGHGTHVAGTAIGGGFGVAQSARVVPVRVLDCNGGGFASDVIAGVNWIVSTHPGGPAIINMSLGGPQSSALNAAVEQAVSRGFIVVAAAGNSGSDACSVSPVSARGVIGVGASTPNDSFASFSNFGSCVDTLAPGTGIVSAWVGSGGSSASLSGTSMAAPHVAGMAARILQANPGTGASGILQTLSGYQPEGGVSDVPSGTGSVLSAWEEVPLDEEELAEEDELLEEDEELAEGGRPEGVGRDFAPGRELAPGLNRENGPPGLNRENGPPGLNRDNGAPGASGAETAPGAEARATAPGRIGRLTITQDSDSQITVRWPALSPAPEQVMVMWQIRGNPESEQDVLVSGTTREVVISGLEARTTYVLSVMGVNSNGSTVLRGQVSTETFRLNPIQPPAQQAPAEQQRQPSPPAPTPAPSRPRPPAPEETVQELQEEPSSPGGGRANAPGQNR